MLIANECPNPECIHGMVEDYWFCPKCSGRGHVFPRVERRTLFTIQWTSTSGIFFV